MAVHLSRKEVLHLARLARIYLNDDEVERFRKDLSEVIDYNMTKLEELSLDGFEPTLQTTGLKNVWRDDTVGQSFDQEASLANAPAKKNGFFMVKAVLGVGS
jgi:aspartyl-tRNA(Asn)/glutamyl-tRNA(Gln) amidotransferase subunit C